jgi:hypothetical protein
MHTRKNAPKQKTDAKIKLDAGDGIFSLAAAKRGEYTYAANEC